MTCHECPCAECVMRRQTRFAEGTMNQCMGCQGQWPLNERGYHKVPPPGYTHETVACTKGRYQDPGQGKGKAQIEPPSKYRSPYCLSRLKTGHGWCMREQNHEGPCDESTAKPEPKSSDLGPSRRWRW